MHSGKITAALKLIFVAILVVLQILIMVLSVSFMRQYFAIIYSILEAACMIVIIALINKNDNQVYKLSWAIVVAVFSVSGLLMYFLWGRTNKSRKIQTALEKVEKRSRAFTRRDEHIINRMGDLYPVYKRFSVYLDKQGFPLFSNTSATYLPLGEKKFEALFADMEKAEKFIFLEYFIVFEGKIFDRMYEILRRKAKEGVEIRFIYDDAGSLVTTTKSFLKRFEKDGINHLIFNPMHRYVDKMYFNYRNHQKIAVIDGNIGYTGGINIGDEYANLYEKHGHWKDTAIRLTGEGVWGLTRIFLEMWEFSDGFVTNDYSIYYPSLSEKEEGFFQPFADGPTNNPHNPAETMYSQIIANAKDYVYISSPYLTIDEGLMKTMLTAAQSGVDIRIVTPKIFDHWYTDFVTHSYYETLLKEGVRIFEYTPGFMHSKTIVSDDNNAIVGSINLDYRSFYLHYECGVWMFNTPAVDEIKQDYLKVFDVSEEIMYEQWKQRPLRYKIREMVLRVFAPVM